MKRKLVIFASGSGSNAEKIIEYLSNHPTLEISCVLSNKSDAYVLERVRELGVESYYFPKSDFDLGIPIVDFLQNRGIEGIILAGFLLKVSQPILQAFPQKIINIHPALLPKYGGKGMYGHFVHEVVKAAGERESGITIHYVNEHYDEGNIIFQAKCSLDADDGPEEIARKVQKLEHTYFPRVVEKVFGK